MNEQDIIVNSFEQVNFKKIKNPACVIYNDTTKDYPGSFVARIFNDSNPQNIVVLKSTLMEICEDLKEYFPKATFIPAAADDDPVIIGTYF